MLLPRWAVCGTPAGAAVVTQFPVSLFSGVEGWVDPTPDERFDTLPVSVVEVAPSGSRGDVDHDSQSSRGGYSAFPPEVAGLCAQFFLRSCSLIVDPFAGWGERGSACAQFDRQYVGFDISPAAIANAREKFGVTNTLADSLTVDVPMHDGLFTCPPYWNLEQYDDGLDRVNSWSGFLSSYRNILTRFAEKAATGATYCVMTGDWRKDGVYYDLTYQTEKILESIGFTPHDKVVVSRLGITKVKIMLPQAKRLGYTVKVHESLSVYRKKPV